MTAHPAPQMDRPRISMKGRYKALGSHAPAFEPQSCLMTMDHQPAQRKSKKNVSTACMHCRKRKAKCDGKLPKCSNCQAHEQECAYQFGVDKRKIPLKSVVEHLTDRVELLEQTLRQHGIQLPSSNKPSVRRSDQSVLGSGFSENLANESKIQLKSLSSEAPDDNGLPGAFFDQHDGLWSIDTISNRQLQGSSSEPDHHTSERVRRGFEASPNAADYQDFPTVPTQDQDSDDPIVDQLSQRIGSLQVAEDGQLRYFGATSNLHILHSGPSSLSRSSIRRIYDAQAVLDKAGLGHYVDEELEDHLIKLYLAWEDAAIHVVHEEVFFQEREKCKTSGNLSPFYSEVLTNAMCALGAAFTPRLLSDFPDPASEFFASRAKALLDVEMDSPTVATVQAFVILSAIEAMFTRDARGWLYSGMAMRLSIDLGLHLDASQLVSAGVLNQEESDARCVTFWGSFLLDRLWGLYVGRPNIINESDITAPLPRPNLHPLSFWQPYLDQNFEIPLASHIPDLMNETLQQNISICKIMGQINRALYMDSETSLAALQKVVIGLQQQLDAWLEDLPECIKLRPNNLSHRLPPHAIQLHMQYQEAILYLYRPFLPKDMLHRYGSYSQRQIAAREACTAAASSISKLLSEFRRLYTLRRANIQLVHIVFTAALFLTYNFSRGQSPGLDEIQDDLQVCCQALGDLSQAFKNAARALEVITRIKHEWQIRRHNTIGRKRGSWSVDETPEGESPRKKKFWSTAGYDDCLRDVDMRPFLGASESFNEGDWGSNDDWLTSLFGLSSTEF